MSEVTVLRKELTILQTRLEALETRLTTMLPSHVQLSSHKLATAKDKTVKSKETISHVSVKHSKKSCSDTKGNSQTLRSRSFKVMRHLINVVDISHLGQQQMKTEVKRKTSSLSRTTGTIPAERLENSSNDQTSFLKTTGAARRSESKHSGLAYTSDTPKIFHPKRPRKEVQITGASTLFQSPSSPKGPFSATVLPTTTDLQRLMKDKSVQEPVRPPSRLETTLNESSDSSRYLHPKRPRKVKFPNNSTTLNQQSEVVFPKTAEISMVTRTPENILPEVFAYNKLPPRCGRFSLLKHDPAMLDLLPISVKEKQFIKTSSVTDIENLQQASEILVQRQVLGIWEWKAGTSRATLHEYKTPELGTTISNRRFKFVGFAWKGALGQQPPRIEELHEDISQGADTLRWYWFKDLWLLFYFD
ncbi:uncharacterized protein PGTG_06845 [Puccinia graminis f. sp. tritici CRL 75-36-700-3]|uniref:Uncharacterized protein n=1 Tax=Puccinia graminis f. sp. tritici (strain CRL 75-36-700-3 / race SCCL) TaxID=418459 RepID=E3KA58_PUCGT|nr:uncharacterized protein PGTG_06845 [Puccinia graminis f. sp. tritici CRL 75-36-700-3]EFP81224.1 hypothetical protein PGTG_06845 [Puccinia graminis f. sp. tritici CRL 75-36-700-3]